MHAGACRAMRGRRRNDRYTRCVADSLRAAAVMETNLLHNIIDPAILSRRRPVRRRGALELEVPFNLIVGIPLYHNVIGALWH